MTFDRLRCLENAQIGQDEAAARNNRCRTFRMEPEPVNSHFFRIPQGRFDIDEVDFQPSGTITIDGDRIRGRRDLNYTVETGKLSNLSAFQASDILKNTFFWIRKCLFDKEKSEIKKCEFCKKSKKNRS